MPASLAGAEPWLSVAMPVHHGERWLAETLASVASQDCSGIEFILIDSSGDSACAEIMASFAARIAIDYQHRPDLKPWTAKTNLAVRQARAAHVAMLHQDDLWLPGRVEDMRGAIAAHPGAALLLNPSHIIDHSGHRLGLWRCPLPYGQELAAPALAERLLIQNFVAIPAPIARRDAWLEAGGMDEELWYTADWDLYLKLSRQGTTVYRNTPSTAFRIHASSLTVTGSADREDFARQLERVVERHIQLVPEPRRKAVGKGARASCRVNAALAQAMTGRATDLPAAALALMRLGPSGAFRYLRDSRILERTLPRLRARLAGAF